MNDDKDKRDDKEKGMPIVVMKDKELKMKYARVVPKKGVDPYAVDRIKRDLEQLGHKKVTFKSDQENSTKALKQAVKTATDMEIITEESPVGEHQANGDVENSVNNIKGQFRTMKDALDTRYNKRWSGEHPAMPWLGQHAADKRNRTRVGADGKTAYRRWKGKSFNKPIAEFGENVWYLKLASAGKDKFNSRWEEGIYMGCINETGETIIGTQFGTVKARDFRRKTFHKDRWDRENFDNIKGTPWEPTPGRNGDYIIKSRIVLPDAGPVSMPARGREDEVKEHASKRFKIFKNRPPQVRLHAGLPRL